MSCSGNECSSAFPFSYVNSTMFATFPMLTGRQSGWVRIYVWQQSTALKILGLSGTSAKALTV